MDWKRERDALIAQTMAFVQSVTGKKEEFGVPGTGFGVAPTAFNPAPAPAPTVPELDFSPAPQTIAPVETARPAPPPAIGPAQAPRATFQTDMQSEIRARIASFRAHQDRFNREREEYFSKTLAKLRASINENPAQTDK